MCTEKKLRSEPEGLRLRRQTDDDVFAMFVIVSNKIANDLSNMNIVMHLNIMRALAILYTMCATIINYYENDIELGCNEGGAHTYVANITMLILCWFNVFDTENVRTFLFWYEYLMCIHSVKANNKPREKYEINGGNVLSK